MNGEMIGLAKGGQVRAYAEGDPGVPVEETDEERIARLEAAAAATPPNNSGDRFSNLQSMLDMYAPATDYSTEIEAARAANKSEIDAFSKLIEAQMLSNEEAKASPAETYFRLAAAFGAPTKTGAFTENLALAGKEMADIKASDRKAASESRKNKLALQAELQKLKMTASQKDLDTLRALQGESNKDIREIRKTMLQEYIASGKPQSNAGKLAIDMGFTPGTAAYQRKVDELARLDVLKAQQQLDIQLAQIAATNARTAATQAQTDATSRNAQRLTTTELNMKLESDQAIEKMEQAFADVAEAYRINPNTYAGGWLDRGSRWLYEVAGSDDPKIVNTRRLDNLLGQQALASLKLTFGGNPTEGERAILLELQGIGSKSIEERRQIILRLMDVLDTRLAAERERNAAIASGQYGVRTSEEEETE